jgi:transcription elongation factor SPT5
MAGKVQGKYLFIIIVLKPGKERDVIFSLMAKAFATEMTDQPMRILSAFSREGVLGYVYIEADKEAHVHQAIESVKTIYGRTLKLVPVNEMVDCLTIKKKDIEVKVGNWVRVKKGRKFNGDLAQV